MIRKQGAFTVHEDGILSRELFDSVEALPSGEYDFFIFDKQKNRSLPQLKYLFGIVLKTISEKLPSHPPVDALYRYFEEVYAPIHVCDLPGEKFEYFNLKNEKAVEMDNIIECIIHHASQQWGITVPTRDELRNQEAKEAYIDAYVDMWKNLPTHS